MPAECSVGFVGLLVSGFFLLQGYSICATLHFALAAAMGRLQEEKPSADTEATRGSADSSEQYRVGGIPAE
jgi:hypothetical protein